MRRGGGASGPGKRPVTVGPPGDGAQTFVNVAFDFEYIAEDGKKVRMKENEVLLLISKTNHDWWQVRNKLIL